MDSRSRHLFGVCAGILALAAYGSMQTLASTALVVGRVVDADSGAPVAGATVEMSVQPAHPAQGAVPSLTLNNVQLQGGISFGTGSGNPVRVLTGPDGQFVFRDVPAGRADFGVTATGYTGGEYNQVRPDGSGQALDIADGQRLGSVVLKMWKDAVITGRLIDEAGEPVVGALVRALRRSRVAGQPILAIASVARPTDDRGVYRIQGLMPGAYVIEAPLTKTTTPTATLDWLDQMNRGGAATGRAARAFLQSQGMAQGPQFLTPAGTAVAGQQFGDLVLSTGRAQLSGADALAPVMGSDGRMAAYATTFYPSATISSRAAIVTLKSGDERPGIDIQLTAARAYRVSGQITDLDGSPAVGMGVHLSAVDDQGNPDIAPDEVAGTVTAPTGEFTLLGVPAGNYQLGVLRAPAAAGARGAATPLPPGLDRPTAWARQLVSVDNSDVTGLAIALRPGLVVSGRVVFEGASPLPTGPQLGRGIRLVPVAPLVRISGRGGGAGFTAQAAQISPDGTFVINGASPGKYELLAPGWPLLKWAPKSVVAAGQDTSDVLVDLDADLTGVVVTFTDRPGALSGIVRTSSGQGDSTALVVGFPTDSRAMSSGGMHTFSARTNAAGAYTVDVLAPGTYNVVAIPDVLSRNWQDPDVLSRLAAAAVHVRVDDGRRVTQDLTTSAVR